MANKDKYKEDQNLGISYSPESEGVVEPKEGIQDPYLYLAPGNIDKGLLAREYALAYGKPGVNILFASYGLARDSGKVFQYVRNMTEHVRSLPVVHDEDKKTETLNLSIGNGTTQIGGGTDPIYGTVKRGAVWWSTGRGPIQFSGGGEGAVLVLSGSCSCNPRPRVRPYFVSNRLT